MSLPFLIAAAPRSVLFTTPTGQTHILSASHTHFAVASSLVRSVESARRDGDPTVVAAALLLLSNIAGLTTPNKSLRAPKPVDIERYGRFVVTDKEVRLDGEVLYSPVAERVLWLKQQGLDFGPHLAFAANLMENPARRPVEDLFDYVDSRGLAIDADGYIIGYEALDEPGDPESGERLIGRTVTVRRNRTEENPLRPCQASLKVGPFPAGTALRSGERLVVVRVHPRDVVSVPAGTEKLRCCAFDVLAECSPTAPLPSVAVSAAWAARSLEPESEFSVAAMEAEAPAPVVLAREAEPAAEAPVEEKSADVRLGRFTRAMMRAHDAIERLGKQTTEPTPESTTRPIPSSLARPAPS